MNQSQQQVNIDFKNTEEFKCKECDHTTFKQVFIIRRLSALLSPNGQESFIPINTFSCSKCGEIPEQFLPSLD